jgi:threonine aldolase
VPIRIGKSTREGLGTEGVSMVRERSEAVATRADAVVFVGDGEPSTPQELARHIERLADDGRIEPDDYSRGGSVEALERAWAELLGKEAAVWLPTGTLANHLAVRRLSGSRPRVLVPERSHLYHDEGDALQRLSGIAVVPFAPGRVVCGVDELRAHLDEAEQGRVLNPVGAFVIESPMRRLAGQVAPFEELEALTALCRERGVGTHLDGARLFMMSAATGVPARRYAELFDTVYLSLWKYLPAPFGAILAGPAALLEGLYHERRMFGGGLPSAALAAALALDGMPGLEARHVEVMTRGRALCAHLAAVHGLEPRPFEHGSNVVPLHLEAGLDLSRFAACLLDDGIVIGDHSEAWDAVLLTFNTTLLRRPVEALTASFEAAARSAR